jgi:pilus assembly protein CpaB
MLNTEQNKIKNKTWKLFTAALVFAMLAGLGTMLYLNVLEKRLKKSLTPPQKEMTQVVVASRDLPTGSIINSSTMSVRHVPKAYVNSDVFTPDQFDSIQGAILVKPLQQGKMLAQDYIDLKIPKDFSGTIQAGHRAITIQVDEINSISGMIKPGNVIDLFTRMSLGGSARSSSASSGEAIIPVLEDVLVLATDKHSARPNEDEFKHLSADDRRRAYNTLTLEVTPKEAALVAIAESRGELIFILRNSNDTGGILFSKITLADLLAHSGEMLESAISKQHNRNIDGIHRNKDGQLVTRDGVVITDPNVHLNKNGLLVTDNGTVLTGRDLMVGANGRIRTKNGKLIDTASLKPGKNGALVDKNGNVLSSNGYTTTKGGFLVDKDGNVVTPGGHILSGLTVGKDGQVRTKDGQIVTADQISVGKDGRVRLSGVPLSTMKIGKDGNLRTANGRLVQARDLVTVGPDGVVRSKDGKILKGVHVGKDGKLYNADGKEMSATDILAATEGFKENKNGTVTDANGKTYMAKDLVNVDKDGTVRTKDGTVLRGVHLDKDGKLRDKNGNLLTAADIVEQSQIAKAQQKATEALMTSQGFKKNADGTITDKSGKIITAKDLVTVGKDGKVRTKDGTVLRGVYVGKDGKLRNKDGSILTPHEIFTQSAIAKATQKSGAVLKGVTGKLDSAFANRIREGSPKAINTYIPYEVEYIIGGNSDGSAKTFKVQIDNKKYQGKKQ